MSPARSSSTSARPSSWPNETRSSTGWAERGVRANGVASSTLTVGSAGSGTSLVGDEAGREQRRRRRSPAATSRASDDERDRPQPVDRAAAPGRCPPPAGGGVNVSSCVSINDLTVRMAWIAGLAVVALVLAGWRKTARAQPKRPRSPTETPRRVPYQVAEAVAPPYHPAGPLRRVWSVVASSGLALVIGAVHRHRHGVRPGVDRHDAHRPARAVTDRRAVAVAGHTGDVATARRGLAHADPGVRDGGSRRAAAPRRARRRAR